MWFWLLVFLTQGIVVGISTYWLCRRRWGPNKSTELRQQVAVLTEIIDVIPYAVFWKDRSSNYLGCNRYFAELAGISDPRNIIGKCDFDLAWDAEEAKGYRADDAEVMRAAKSKLYITETQRNAQGRMTWIDTSKVPLLDDDGEVFGVLGVFRDVTESHVMREELERTKRYLNDAIEAIDAGLCMYDGDERLVFCNQKYRRMYGMADGQTYAGIAYKDILHQQPEIEDGSSRTRQERVEDLLRRHRESGDAELKLGDRWFQVSNRKTDDGGVVSLQTDVTDFKRINEELSLARDAAEQANQAKSDFLANTSHEIRTPLTAILGYLELLADPSDIDNYASYLSTIRSNAEHLLRVINDILDLSRIEAGRFELETMRTSPAVLTREVVRLMRPRAHSKGLALDVSLDASLPDWVTTDPTRLRQILLNLIGNSIKFTAKGGVTVRVSWVAGPTGLTWPAVLRNRRHWSRYSRRPNRPTFFPRSRKPTTASTRRFGGTGLGLTISRSMAQLLGGDISATGTPGVGSTFTVMIEAAVAEEGQSIPVEFESDTSRAFVPLDNSLLTGRRILLAEDTRVNQVLIQRLLSKAGAEVAVADDGRQAVEETLNHEAQGHPFDVVLMDMQMPVLDGYAATAELRRNGYHGAIVALTAHAMASDRKRCLDAGCTDYLTKPVDRQSLLETCSRYTTEAHAQARPESAN